MHQKGPAKLKEFFQLDTKINNFIWTNTEILKKYQPFHSEIPKYLFQFFEV